MSPSSAGAFGHHPGDVLSALAVGLAADASQTGRKTLKVIRARSPDLVRMSEATGEDLIATSVGFIDVLLTSLRSDLEVPWSEYEQRTRDYGRLKAAQGVPLETLIDVLAVYRRATIELITQPIEGTQRRDEIFALAQSRLEDVVERLTTCVVRGYLEHLDTEHRTRESELFGLAAIVTSMGRSLDVVETAEVALVETMAALRLSAGALWLRERAAFRLAHAAGLDAPDIEQFTHETGPHVKAAVTAVGRSESRVDRGLGAEWNALRAQLRVRGRVVGVMTVGTRMPRIFGASDLLFMAAVADQVAIALDRARLRAAVNQASLAAKSPEPIEVSMGLTAWRPGQDWQAAYEVVDGELYEDKRRRKEEKRLAPKVEKTATPLRILGRSSGRRRLAGG